MVTKPKSPRLYQKLDERNVEMAVGFLRDDGITRIFWDSQVRGLRLRIGRHRCSWSVLVEHRFRGKRSSTFRRLGIWPALTVKDARQDAKRLLGSIASGREQIGPRKAATHFKDAVTDFLVHTREESARKGKKPTWARAIQYMNAKHFEPWQDWTLKEMSDNPRAVQEWFRRISKKEHGGPVAANRAGKTMRAIFYYAAKLDRSLAGLPPPTSAIKWNPEQPRETGISDFVNWSAKWRAINNDVKRGAFLFGLASGCRPGEIGTLRYEDLDFKARTFKVRNNKRGTDVTLPLSLALVIAIKIARGKKSERTGLLFPGAEWGHHLLGLEHGHTLRHTYRTIGAQEGVPDLVVSLLLGHSLGAKGVTAAYLSQMMMAKELRRAQAKISRAVLQRLDLA